ncbi:MAG: glycosyltransferase family 4 protein [Chloroflexota bacterium]|nr:glycosyltransferase family 4 protein [Chloroflexota bacterium]
MRLTLLIFSLESGGAEKIVSTQANYWATKGWEVTFITICDIPAFYKLEPSIKLNQLGICPHTIHHLKSGGISQSSRGNGQVTKGLNLSLTTRLLNNLKRLYLIRQAIQTSHPEVVISFMDRENVLTLLATLGLPVSVIVTEHSDPTHHSIGNRWWRYIQRLAYRRAAAIAVLTPKSVEYFPDYLQKKCRVIPNPVSLPDHQGVSERVSGIGGQPKGQRPAEGSEETPQTPDTRHPTPSDGRKVVISIGRLIPLKGFDMLIQAFAKVAPQYPDWSLEIWGEGEARPELEALCQKLKIADRVRLPGFTEQPLEKLRQANLFVLSSHYEGFPTVLWEAMGCGLPAISFDCPSGPAMIIRNGLDGILVPPNDIEALSQTMGDLMGDETARNQLAAHAPEVLERFSVEKVMGEWDKLITETRLRTSRNLGYSQLTRK